MLIVPSRNGDKSQMLVGVSVFFVVVVKKWPLDEGNSLGVFSTKLHSSFCHESHFTCKFLCKSAFPVRWTQTEMCDLRAHTVGWVSSHEGVSVCVEGFLLACSIMPPQIPRCPWAYKGVLSWKSFKWKYWKHMRSYNLQWSLWRLKSSLKL